MNDDVRRGALWTERGYVVELNGVYNSIDFGVSTFGAKKYQREDMYEREGGSEGRWEERIEERWEKRNEKRYEAAIGLLLSWWTNERWHGNKDGALFG